MFLLDDKEKLLSSTRLPGSKMASELGPVTVTRLKSFRMDEPACVCRWSYRRTRVCTPPWLPIQKETL